MERTTGKCAASLLLDSTSTMSRLFAFFLLFAESGCDCARWEFVHDAGEVTGEYIFRRINQFDPTDRLIVNPDGGYCHRFEGAGDAGWTQECGGWTFSDDGYSTRVYLSDLHFRDPLPGANGACFFERRKTQTRLSLNDDDGIYFWGVDAGLSGPRH